MQVNITKKSLRSHRTLSQKQKAETKTEVNQESHDPFTTATSEVIPTLPPSKEQAGAESDISLDVMIYKVRFYTLLSFIRWLPYFLAEKRLTRFWEVLDRWHELVAKGKKV